MATYHVSSGGTEKSIIYENETVTAIDGGVQVVLDLQASPRQIIYLDFDGELTKYRNADLDLEIDGVQVEDSMLTPERIAGIVAKLNTDFSVYNVLFVTERPEDTAYSTIFIGKTSAFEQYGRFAGLAETVDLGNMIKNDNAFVLLDAASSDSDIVSTIAHEVGHLLGTLDHGGDGLARYAEDIIYYTYYYLKNNCTLVGNLFSSVSLQHIDSSITIFSAEAHEEIGDTYVYKGDLYDKAAGLTILGGGYLLVNVETTARGIDIKEGGTLCIFRGSLSGARVYNGGVLSRHNDYYGTVGEVVSVYVYAGAIVHGEYQNITLGAGGGAVESFVNLSEIDQQFSYVGLKGAVVQDKTLSNLICFGHLDVSSGGIVNVGTVVSGANWNIDSFGRVSDFTINNGGSAYVGKNATLAKSFDNLGNLWVDSGGLVTIWSPSHTNGETSSFVNNGRIDFCVASATVNDVIALIDDYKNIVDNGTFTITVNGEQETGEYRLLGNAAVFRNSISIWVLNPGEASDLNEESQLSGTFLWNGVGYNAVRLHDRVYKLNFDESNTLVLSVVLSTEVEVYDDDALTSAARAMTNVFLNADGDNRMVIYSGGTATDTTASANTQILVFSGGVLSGGTMTGCRMDFEGELCGQLVLDGGLNILSEKASAEDAEIFLQVRSDTGMSSAAGIIGLDYLSGASLTIEVDPELNFGTYHLASGANDFKQTITVKKDNKESTYLWNDDKKVYVPDKYIDFLSLVKNDDDLDLIYRSYTIVDFEGLKTAVSADWQQFKVQVKLDKFNDLFKGGWGKLTNRRPYYSVTVNNLAFSAEGTENHIDITCNGHFNGRIGILTVDADLSENLTVNGEKAGLYLSVNKNEQSGEWEWGDWDLVGKFTVTLQRVDHRFKFHLSETVFDPMNIKGTAEIDTKNGVYTIQGDWQASKHKGLNHATVVATLKDCSTPSDPEKGLELSSFSITLSDAYNRQAFNAGFNLYLVDGRCYNLASCDTEPAGFEGKIGFTWNSYTHRIDKEWQRKLLSAVGIKKDDYYPTNYLTVSAIDTLLEAKMNSDGDFSAKGEVRFLNVLSKSQNADTLSVAWITGEVSYFASNESLAVKGNVGLAGIAEMSGFVWSINNRLQISAQGTFRIPGWMEFLTGYSTLSGYLELVSTDQATCIAVWGEATKENGQISYMGYRYNLTNGDIADISNAKDVESVYQNFTDVLAKDTTGTKRFDKDFMEQYERLQSLIFNGGYSCASESLQVCVTNETTGMQFEFRLADYAENAGNGNGGNASGSGSDSETVQIKVESFNTGGFSIRLDGNKDHLSGDWRVDIRDEGADLEGLELSLQCVESPNCQLKDYSVTGISSNSVAIDYSVSGGDDDVVVSVNCIKHDEEGPQVVCVGILGIEENQAAIDTSVAAASGFYEFYLHVTGNFIPFDSEINAVFSIADRTESDGAIVEDMAALRATEYWMVVSSSQDSGSYAIASSAGGFDKSITIMTDSGSTIGAISVGETKCFDNMQYSLNMTDDTLLFEVVSSVVPVPERTFFTGDFDGDLFDTLAVQFGSSVTVYMNGEPWGLGITLEDGWTIAGVGDFNGDGLDDFLRVNDEGYVVGEMSNGNGTFSPQVLNFLNEGWDILGTGDFNGNGTDDVLIANPTAASETIGLLGYWESGVTWTLINGYSAEWEMVATGDFNGDGKCDMLWRNWFEGDGGLTYNAYCTWIVDDPVDWRMVSVANPAEWDFLCSGDFDGDKMNDIAMINNEGVVGIWGVEDGYLSSWSILSAVDTSEWTLAGVGDFDGDGTDDIAWCNTETGQVGCWQIENRELAGWQTLATLG